jgi:hypothetical protein
MAFLSFALGESTFGTEPALALPPNRQNRHTRTNRKSLPPTLPWPRKFEELAALDRRPGQQAR